MNTAIRTALPFMTLTAFAFLAVASGGKTTRTEGSAATTESGGGAVKSCTMKYVGKEGEFCIEYPVGKDNFAAELGCNMMKNKWKSGPCSTSRVVGKCVKKAIGKDEMDQTQFAYADNDSESSAKEECESANTKDLKTTFTAGDFKPAEDEARGSCMRHMTGSKKTGPDQCEEVPFTSSPDTLATFKMNCSGEDGKFTAGKGCAKEEKAKAVSKCIEKDGTTIYNFPPEARNAKDFCEGEPGLGKYSKLTPGGGAAPSAARPGTRH
jgi:hypothetical protein